MPVSAFCTSGTPYPAWIGCSAAGSCALPMRAALTWSGEAPGYCDRYRAASPDTTAAACEVPDPRKNRLPTRAWGLSWSAAEFGARRPSTCTPGAIRST